MIQHGAASECNRQRLGFRDGDKGVHSSRTLMLAELELLLAATPPEAETLDFRRAVVDDNVLGKRTATTREHTVRKLKALYGLNPAIAVYRVMRELWRSDEEGRPLLALLCAVARDPLLRASAEVVLETNLGATVTQEAIAATVRPSFSASTRDAIVSHLLSTWRSAGLIGEKKANVRTKPRATWGAAAYALALGFMEGGRGSLLLATPWSRLLSCPQSEMLELVHQADLRGFVEYRAAGDIMTLRADLQLTDEERTWCNG